MIRSPFTAFHHPVHPVEGIFKHVVLFLFVVDLVVQVRPFAVSDFAGYPAEKLFGGDRRSDLADVGVKPIHSRRSIQLSDR